ncbi:MAG: type IV secretion system DNA-binding domain-containing protein, partial [Dehalococcoidia bacterium]|nr:type IV secretion system DNA-binding domain-containing protein [Dehalococcoidia bacterium]
MDGITNWGGRRPAAPIMLALWDVAEAIFRAENVGPIEPIWQAIESDALVAVNFRNMLARRRRYAADFARTHGIITTQLAEACRRVFDTLPESCFANWPEDGSAFEVPLIELVDDPAALIERLIIFAYTDETMQLELFLELRERYATNLLVASGFPPDANPHEVNHKLIMPTRQRDKSAAELVDMYLAGTPFAHLLELPVPLHIPDEVRFEHAHILGGTGHGKTQLLQRMIHADLVAAQDDGRSIVVIDSQGDLINKLVRLDLFDPQRPGTLADRLVLIDPTDIEFPAALNLFDAHLDRVADYRAVDRERVLNGAVELYETLFGDMLGAELTQKQGVVFRYLARLMVSIPGATIHTLMQLMEDGRPWKAHMPQLEGSARYFFETEFFHPSFAATKKQILRRLWGVLSTPAFERMFAQPKNKLDLFEATRTGKIVLVSTAKDLLKSDGSALLGRFVIRMLAQAALERSVLPEDERTPTYVYVDEAQEYFDEGVETILQQARKYRVSFVCAHQSLDQASPRLRSALMANTSFKCAGGVSAKDARVLADELHTSPDFIGSMKRRGGRSEFAAWIKHWTPGAIRLSVPLGFLERQPTITEEQVDELMGLNRVRYCGTIADAYRTLPPVERPPNEEPVEHPRAEADETAAGHEPSAELVPERPRYEPPRPRSEAPPAPAERELGKGGQKHRY